MTKSQSNESNDFAVYPFLTSEGRGRKFVHLDPKQPFFCQGDVADSVFFFQTGRAKLTIVSDLGKEATIAIFGPGDFAGEDSLSSDRHLRVANATAITGCTALRIDKDEMRRHVREEPLFSEHFVQFLLRRSVLVQSDLAYHLLNYSERRLARVLLLLAETSERGQPTSLLPPITQESLAEMTGCARSRVNVIMNRFRRLGYIKYSGHKHPDRILVHTSLQKVAEP